MVIFSNIMMVLTIMICVNTLTFNIIDNKTKYRGNKQGDMGGYTKLFILCLFFGPFLLFFIKKLRHIRKETYLKDRIDYYRRIGVSFLYEDSLFNDEMKKMERKLKLSQIHRKAKRKHTKKKIINRLKFI